MSKMTAIANITSAIRHEIITIMIRFTFPKQIITNTAQWL